MDQDVQRNTYLKIKGKTCQKQPLELFYKKAVLKNYRKSPVLELKKRLGKGVFL